jgi:hypothetical protein
MREALLGKLVLVLSGATPEELAAIYRFATGQPLESAECGVRSAELKRGRADGSSPAGAKGGRAYVFRWTGRDWEVVFGGGWAFHLPNTLGARYLNHLLHGPNAPISAFDLEVTVQREKAEARSRNSVQPESDGQALGEYRQELRRLQAERQAAQAAGDQEEQERRRLKPAAARATRASGRAITFAMRSARSWLDWKKEVRRRGRLPSICGRT